LKARKKQKGILVSNGPPAGEESSAKRPRSRWGADRSGGSMMPPKNGPNTESSKKDKEEGGRKKNTNGTKNRPVV